MKNMTVKMWVIALKYTKSLHVSFQIIHFSCLLTYKMVEPIWPCFLLINCCCLFVVRASMYQKKKKKNYVSIFMKSSLERDQTSTSLLWEKCANSCWFMIQHNIWNLYDIFHHYYYCYFSLLFFVTLHFNTPSMYKSTNFPSKVFIQ